MLHNPQEKKGIRAHPAVVSFPGTQVKNMQITTIDFLHVQYVKVTLFIRVLITWDLKLH